MGMLVYLCLQSLSLLFVSLLTLSLTFQHKPVIRELRETRAMIESALLEVVNVAKAEVC